MPRAKRAAKSEEPQQPTRETVTVALIAPLVHAGVLCVAGDKIEVKQRQVEWLRGLGVIA